MPRWNLSNNRKDAYRCEYPRPSVFFPPSYFGVSLLRELRVLHVDDAMEQPRGWLHLDLSNNRGSAKEKLVRIERCQNGAMPHRVRTILSNLRALCFPLRHSSYCALSNFGFLARAPLNSWQETRKSKFGQTFWRQKGLVN